LNVASSRASCSTVSIRTRLNASCSAAGTVENAAISSTSAMNASRNSAVIVTCGAQQPAFSAEIDGSRVGAADDYADALAPRLRSSSALVVDLQDVRVRLRGVGADRKRNRLTHLVLGRPALPGARQVALRSVGVAGGEIRSQVAEVRRLGIERAF